MTYRDKFVVSLALALEIICSLQLLGDGGKFIRPLYAYLTLGLLCEVILILVGKWVSLQWNWVWVTLPVFLFYIKTMISHI